MTAFQAVALMLGSLQPQEAPRIDDMPKRVCFEAQRAIFRIENRAAVPVLVALRIEHWTDEGDTAGWTLFQPDVTQREAQPKQVRNLAIDARGRRDFVWELQKRALPQLATGRYRLVATYAYKGEDARGSVTHEFWIADCGG
jgi:P pilus assembly chaperone PapD